MVGDVVVGAIGVSSGTVAEDRIVAEAAAAWFARKIGTGTEAQ
jgi:uncharacterized protein GlcG (DUF336 family)